MYELVAIAICGAVVTTAIIVALVHLGNLLSESKDKLGDARVDAANKAGQLAIAASDIATHKARADIAEQRIKDLDALITTARDVGPVDGAFERLLQEYATARSNPATASSGRTESVPSESTTTEARSGDLARPGD